MKGFTQSPAPVHKAEKGRSRMKGETTKIELHISKMVHSDDLLSEFLRHQRPSEEKEEKERP